MGLINLQTNLKSLRFGNDRVHGGSSKQPYIQTPIPENSGGFGVLDTDFILRGGSKAVTNSITDVERLGKYFLDIRNPSGLLFIAKQNLLSRTAVRTQASGFLLNEGAYTPISTLLEAGGVAFGLHVNKQGLNPFDGLGSIGKYNNVVTQFQPNNQNRLVNIYNDKQDQPSFALSLDPVNVRTYTGGPNSILGIGKTNIRFADQRTGEASGHSPKYLFGLPNGNGAIGSNTDRTDIPLNYRNALGLSVSSSYYENGNISLPIVNLNTQESTGLSEDGVGVGTYYAGVPGQPSNVTIGNLIGNQVNYYQKYGHNVDVNYRNALGLSISSSYYENGNSSLPIIDLSKYAGVDGSYSGATPYYVGKNTNVTIGNLIGDAVNVYQKYGNNIINIFDNYQKFLGVSALYATPILDSEMRTLNPNNLDSPGVVTFDQNDIINIPTNTISKGESTLTQKGATTVTGDFRKTLNYNLPAAPNYTEKNIEQRVLLGNPGDRSGKNLLSYTNGTKPGKIYGYSGGNASESSYDKINALPLYSDSSPDDKNGNDLVKFRIGVIDNDDPSKKTYIHFRAFLNQISDGYTSEWSDTRYIGRGEKFYTYTGFDRKVSLSWTVAAQSKAELIPMYKKLNFLASICAPDYSAAGYMRGNLVTLTIGGYFYEQPGIITGFSYEMNDDNSTWEIGINDAGGSDNTVKELPHMIKVTGFNFTPIHTFVPRKQQMGYDSQGNILTDANQYGPERYIALANGFGNDQNNYGPVYVNPVPVQPPPIPPVPPVPPPPPEFVPIKIETRNYDNGEAGKFKSDTTTSQNPLAGRDREFEAAARVIAANNATTPTKSVDFNSWKKTHPNGTLTEFLQLP